MDTQRYLVNRKSGVVHHYNQHLAAHPDMQEFVGTLNEANALAKRQPHVHVSTDVAGIGGVTVEDLTSE